MSPKKPKPMTVNLYLVELLGVRRALTCQTFMFCWTMYEVAEGREPVNIEELAEAMGRNPATLYRWQQDFRKAFPKLATPHEMTELLRQRLGERLTPKRVGDVRLDGLDGLWAT